MPDFTFNIELLRARLGPEVADEMQRIQDALNNVAVQTNANPLGPAAAPPQISAVKAIGLGDGHADIAIQDNQPVNRGIHYFAEYSTTAAFSSSTTKTVHMGVSKNVRVPVGSGQVFVRAYSAYPTGPASPPVLHGGGAAISAGGTFAATAGNPGVGSGTEPSLNPRTGVGFGLFPVRPRIVE